MSQRLESSNLKINGEIFVNGQKVPNLTPIRDKMSFVEQFDILNAYTTPQEFFQRTADLIYPKSKFNEKEKSAIIDVVIKLLRIDKCRY